MMTSADHDAKDVQEHGRVGLRRGGAVSRLGSKVDAMAVVFITGPVRSGKSAFGVRLARESGRDVTYIATAAGAPEDVEWRARLVRHVRDRPSAWQTVETAGMQPSGAARALSRGAALRVLAGRRARHVACHAHRNVDRSARDRLHRARVAARRGSSAVRRRDARVAGARHRRERADRLGRRAGRGVGAALPRHDGTHGAAPRSTRRSRLSRRRRLRTRPARPGRSDRTKRRCLKPSFWSPSWCAVVVLAVAAKRLRVPYPIAFVIGGIVLGFARHLPTTASGSRSHLIARRSTAAVQRGVVDGLGSSSNATRGRSRSMPLDWSSSRWPRSPRSSMYSVPAFTWPLAFTLGAIVSPPDAVAAEAIFERIADSAPHRRGRQRRVSRQRRDRNRALSFCARGGNHRCVFAGPSGCRIRRRRRRRHFGRHRGGLRFRGNPSLIGRGAATAIR